MTTVEQTELQERFDDADQWAAEYRANEPMKVHTGESHWFSEDEAVIDQFTVAPLPEIDYAAHALRQAQDAYFAAYPEARNHAADLIWTITKNQ